MYNYMYGDRGLLDASSLLSVDNHTAGGDVDFLPSGDVLDRNQLDVLDVDARSFFLGGIEYTR